NQFFIQKINNQKNARQPGFKLSIMKKIFQISLFFLGFLFATGCVDQTFDLPPVDGVDPNLEATLTIAELKSHHFSGAIENIDSIDALRNLSEVIIKGTVVADDRSGNWFRSFVIQDETGGIEITHTQADAYVFYAIGREVYVRCNGLYMSDDSGVIQLGGYTYVQNGGLRMGAITDIFKRVEPGVRVGEPTPALKTIGGLGYNDINTLVELENMQFVTADAGVTFADVVGFRTLNRTLEDCFGNQIVLRTSGFAEFAGEKTPDGNGTIKAIYSEFNGTGQLFIRELTDIQFDSTRCGQGTDPEPCTGTPPILEELEMDFQQFSDNEDIMTAGWTNQAVSSNRLWRARTFDGNTYAQATAFGDNSGEPMEAWLITPAFDFSVPKVLSFESAQAFYNHDGLSVWISFDFECDATKATWEQLNVPLAGQSDPDHAWIPSGPVELTGYSGIGVIGFRYVGQGPDAMTTSYRIDNIVVEDL
ncbi:MAG: hypothetical protein D6714_12175, partial [Bacteroidetes bacterium]